MPVPAKTKVGNLKCTFEFLKSSEKEITAFNEPLKTVYNSINDYYLYLFKKDNSGSYSLCWNYDQEPARKSSEQGSNGLYLCDFTFERGKRYYGYFSGKKINKDSIDLLKTTGSYKLIEITPRGSGQIRIDHSLFYWISLVQFIEDRIADKSKLLESLIKIYDEDNFTISGVEEQKLQELKDERIIIFPDGKIMDAAYFLKGVWNEINGETSQWLTIFETIENSSEKFIKNSEDMVSINLYDFEDVRNYVSFKNFQSVKIIGAMHGYTCKNDYYQEEIKASSLFENYLLAVNRDEILQSHFPSYKIIGTLRMGNLISIYAREYNGKTVKAEYKSTSIILNKCNFLTLGTKYQPEYTSMISFTYVLKNTSTLVEIVRSKNKINFKINSQSLPEITIRQAKVEIEIYNFIKQVRDDLTEVFKILLEDPAIKKIPDILNDLKSIFNN